MSTEVTIDTNQAETEVTITTNDASTNYTISAGARGASGPNSITTSTLSNLTGFISANGTTVSGATAGSTSATASTLVLRDSSGNITAFNLTGTNTGDQFTSVTSQRLIGRHAGSAGAAQEVQVGDGLEFSGSGIRRSALTGDVTASAGSNATTLASTIAGAKTLSGQLELTGQAATTANSAMNRSLVDARSLVSLQVSNQTINNVATYTASNMTLSLGIGTWELNGLFQTTNAATGGAKIYISVVSGAQPESYTHRFLLMSVNGGSSNPLFSTPAPTYAPGTFPFRATAAQASGGTTVVAIMPSVIVLTAASQIDIGFSQNTAVVGDLLLLAFSKFWAKRLTH